MTLASIERCGGQSRLSFLPSGFARQSGSATICRKGRIAKQFQRCEHANDEHDGEALLAS
jgi:hypothetical protein